MQQKTTTKKTYFVSFIIGYFPALYKFAIFQNYYLYPNILAEELGYISVIIIKEGENTLKEDPNLPKGTIIHEYTNFFHFILLLIKYSFRNSIFYINNHRIESYCALIFTKLFFCKNIFMGHIQPKRTSWLRQLIFEAVIIFTNRVRINNTTEQSFLMGRGVNKNKLYVVPIAVDSSQFYNYNPGHLKRKDIFYYGNTTTQKGIPTILEALVEVRKKLPETRLHIIGSRGNYNPEQDILRLGLTDIVIQHGAFLHGEKLNSILNQYSVFVLSTKAEGQCLAVYESALSGAALCIPNIMSFTDIFEHKALFHEFGDKDTLAENIITYLSNPDIATKHNQLAVDMILSEYNEEVVKQAFVKLLTF